MKISRCLLICLLAGLSILTAQIPANDPATPLVLPRLDGPIILDGYSDEPA